MWFESTLFAIGLKRGLAFRPPPPDGSSAAQRIVRLFFSVCFGLSCVVRFHTADGCRNRPAKTLENTMEIIPGSIAYFTVCFAIGVVFIIVLFAFGEVYLQSKRK